MKSLIYEDGQEQEIAMSDLKKQGQVVIVQTGSMVIDGEIVDGEAMVNESRTLQVNRYKRVTLNDTVYAGTLIEEGKIFVKVETYKMIAVLLKLLI